MAFPECIHVSVEMLFQYLYEHIFICAHRFGRRNKFVSISICVYEK